MKLKLRKYAIGCYVLIISLFFQVMISHLGYANNEFRKGALYESNSFVAPTEEQFTVEGIVTDKANGEALPGVSILVKGTVVGTVTDVDGYFKIEAPTENSVLVISYIGYTPVEIQVNGRSKIDVEMDVTQMEEVVVVGYGKTKKINLLGAISAVSSEDLANQTLTSAGQALMGRVAGVQMIQPSAQPGKDAPTINIRGVNSIRQSADGQNADTSPLVIIDGVQATMVDIHPQDIESISVLKDASSAAIYGARAANGVIIITTKRGLPKKPSISINSYYGWQNATYIPKVLNPYDYALLRNESRTNVGNSPDYNEETLNWFRDYQHEGFWEFAYIPNAPLVNHHISANGGAENVQYMISAGYQGHEGVVLNTNSERFNVRSNIDVTVSEKVKAGVNFSASLFKNQEPTYGGNGPQLLIRDAIRHPPFAMVDGLIHADGYYSRGTLGRPLHGMNAIGLAEQGGMTDESIQRLIPNIYFEYTPVKDLIIRSTGSAFIESTRRSQFRNPHFSSDGVNLQPHEPLGGLSEVYDANTTILFETTANYVKSIGKSNFTGLLGFTDQTFERDVFQASNQGYPNDAVAKLNAGSINPTVSGTGQEWALRSGFARVGYNFDERYLAEVNMRYDGSSRFGQESRWGVFPSFAVGWRMDRERFMQGVDWLNNLKWRANWGQLGNQNIGNYSHISRVRLDQNYVFGNSLVQGAALANLNNPNVRWETTTMSDIGFDATLFNNKVSIETSVYRRISDDILVTPPVPLTLGNLAPPVQNQGKVRNQGIEVLMSYFGNIGQDFSYSISGNWSYNDNVVLELNEEFISANKVITRVGEPISSFFGHRIIGLFNSDAEAQNVERWGRQPGGPRHGAGDYIYADENGDGIINAADRIIIGNTNIRHTLGGTITMDYKGFDFRALFQGVIGRDLEDGVFGNDGLRGGNNLTDKWLDRWTPENQNTTIPRVAQGVNWNTSLFVGPALSYNIVDGSYVRLKHIELGYSFPDQINERLGLSRLRVYVTGQNLLTWTNFIPGFDPESALLFNDTNDAYPQAKTIAVGVNIGIN